MNRGDLQRLSNTRIREARVLFEAGEYSGAYYLAGYAVECALKACFAKAVRRYDFPDKGRARRVFVHDLVELIELVKLKDELLAATKADARLTAVWEIVRDWSEESRYQVWTKEQAEQLIGAIVHRKDGILPWIKRRW